MKNSLCTLLMATVLSSLLLFAPAQAAEKKEAEIPSEQAAPSETGIPENSESPDTSTETPLDPELSSEETATKEEEVKKPEWLPLDTLAASSPIPGTINIKTADPATIFKNEQGKYETDLFTGTATFSYPFWLPPGRNGMLPDLKLLYSSSNTNLSSEVGYGWSLPLGAIYRTTPKGVNELYNRNDFTAELFGSAEELISTDSANGKYAAKVESNFSEYIFQNNTWTMYDRKGVRYTFGANASTRQSDPQNAAHVYKWLLEKVEDPNGNFFTVSYFSDAGQVYPESIRYTGNGSDQGIYEIKFLRSANPKKNLSYRSGFSIETNFLISAVQIFTNVSGVSELIRTYEFSYDQTATNLLKSVTVKAGGSSLPTTAFDYFANTAAINLLQKITFPTGGTAMLTYQSSSAYRTSAQGLANNNLPFLVQTIRTVALQAGSSAPTSTTSYEYAGGHYYFDQLDAYTREYAGFQNVGVTDPVGNVTRMYFHQSEFAKDNAQSVLKGEYADHISKKGRIYREEMYDNANKLFRSVIRKWDKTVSPDDNPQWSRNFPFLAREVSSDYDGNASAKSMAKTWSYDSYGNVTQQTEYGAVTLSAQDGSFTDITGDTRTTTFVYALNPTVHITALPQSQTLKDNSSVVIGETRTSYDGLPLGQVTKGNLTKTEQRIVAPSTYAITQIAYNSFGLPTSSTNPRNFTTTTIYDGKNLFPISITNAKNQLTTAEYSYFFGLPTLVTDPNGLKTSATYDPFGRIMENKVNNPAAPTQQVTTASYNYDTATTPQSVTETKFADALGADSVTKSYVDGFGRVIQVRTEAEGSNQYMRRNLTYDARGNIAKESLPVFASGSSFQTISPGEVGTSYSYDALNRVTATTNSVATTTTSYDDWASTTIDPDGKKKVFTTNAYGDLISVKEYLGATAYITSYSYNLLDQLTRITDAKGNLRNMSYDLLGRRLSLQDLHVNGDTTFGTWNFSYDANANLLSSIDPKGQVVNYTYDQLDRPLTEDFAGAAGTEVSYSYDSGPNAIGRLSSVMTPNVQKSFTYDLLGRLTQEQKILDGNTYITGFSFDLLGNTTSMTYPDATVVNYSYNNALLLEAVQKGNTPIVTNLDMAPNGLLQKIDYANGVSTTNSYDINKLYRLTQKQTLKGATKLQDISYNFDPVGNITQIVDASSTNAGKTGNYTYDDLHRLLSATITGAANAQNYTHTYSYDILGNILTRSDASGAYSYTGGSAATASATVANPHAVTAIGSVNYSYDANSNLTSNGTWTHAWNYKDHLSSSTNGSTTVNYSYDESGQRVLKTNTATGKKTVYVNQYYDLEDGQVKKYIYAGGMKVATETLVGNASLAAGGEEKKEESLGLNENEDNEARASVEEAPVEGVVNDEPSENQASEEALSEEGSGEETSTEIPEAEKEVPPVQTVTAPTLQLIYHHEDHLTGSNVDTDSNGVMVSLIDYYPYGNVRLEEDTTSYKNDYKFTGKELDEDTALYYYGARYYDASVGRFVSADPIAVFTPEKFLDDPQQLGHYSYARNNPLKYIDPLGLYNVETGEIEEGDTEDSIVEQINNAFKGQINEPIAWDQVAELSFFNTDYGTTKAGELVGKYTNLGTDYVSEVTENLNSLLASTGDALAEFEGKFGDMGLLAFAAIFRTGGDYDLKNLEGDKLWGFYSGENCGGSGKCRWNWSYIYNGSFIRFDAPGNILAGYAAKIVGVNNWQLHVGANIEGTIDNFSNGKIEWGDNDLDGDYLDWGYYMNLDQ